MDKRVGLSLKISGSLADKREGEADDLSDLILENSHSSLVIINYNIAFLYHNIM